MVFLLEVGKFLVQRSMNKHIKCLQIFHSFVRKIYFLYFLAPAVSSVYIFVLLLLTKDDPQYDINAQTKITHRGRRTKIYGRKVFHFVENNKLQPLSVARQKKSLVEWFFVN